MKKVYGTVLKIKNRDGEPLKKQNYHMNQKFNFWIYMQTT
jgi:hypothetical protein